MASTLKNLWTRAALALTVALGVSLTPPAEAKFAMSYNMPDLEWYSITTEHFVTHYPVSKKSREEGNEHYLTGEWSARKMANLCVRSSTTTSRKRSTSSCSTTVTPSRASPSPRGTGSRSQATLVAPSTARVPLVVEREAGPEERCALAALLRRREDLVEGAIAHDLVDQQPGRWRRVRCQLARRDGRQLGDHRREHARRDEDLQPPAPSAEEAHQPCSGEKSQAHLGHGQPTVGSAEALEAR